MADITPPSPGVSEEQLTYLLALGHESAGLDYKATLDLRETRDLVELAKDVGAMQVDGGYIVVGADDQGRPVPPGVATADLPRFDEANLRPKLARWLPDGFEIRTASHTLADCTLVVIYVVPNPAGFSIFKADGQYANGKNTKNAFRKGDVFVRHGTSSERWVQADIDRIFDRRVAGMKDAWRAERQADLEALVRAQQAQSLVQGPAANFNWRLDVETFDLATTELLRADDDIPLRRMLNSAIADARQVIEKGDPEELETLIGRITTVIAQGITYQRRRWVDAGLDALGEIYRYGFNQQLLSESTMSKQTLWLVTLEHLLALGALATRQADWITVRTIVVRPPGEPDDYYATWLRHALTEAARANILEEKSLITLAAERAAQVPALRTDLGAEDDRLVTSLCQFDFLAAVTIIGATGKLSSSNWYTNFARFYTGRVTPVAERLLSDEVMRATLFPESDDDLAAALREIDRMASNEGWKYNGWHGWGHDSTIGSFLAEHPVPE
jgi:hypothetical protein